MNLEKEFENFIGFTIIWVVLVLLTYAILSWLHVPTGNILDWVVGAVSFWWAIVIVTIPWNLYFRAKAILHDAQLSLEKGITVDRQQQHYVEMLRNRALWVALGLHGVSTLVLYLLAVTGVSAIGYLSSGVVLLLTGLRPAIAGYKYLVQRLENIGRAVKYPREDVLLLRDRLDKLTLAHTNLAAQLDLDESTSWAAKQQRLLQDLHKTLSQVSAQQVQFEADNAQALTQIAKESRSAIAQLNEDSQFLEQVREIIRFFKAA